MMNDDTEREDDVGRLIRMAGHRPAPPQERTLRVKAAVRAEWLAALRRRRLRRIGWSTAILAAASVLLFASMTLRFDRSGGGSQDEGLLVVSSAAPAWTLLDPASPARALAENERLPFGSTVTTGDAGSVALQLPGGGSVRLDAGSRLIAADAGNLVLEQGAVYVDSGGLGLSPGPSIRTPFGTVREIGTQYEVRLYANGLRVRVREGEVSLDNGGEVHPVNAASELVIDFDGAVTRRPMAIHGPEWEWIARIAKLPDFSGRSAREFLEHVARERGWALRFADDKVEREAGTIRLSGSLDRLSLDSALDVVLPACGMTHTEARGTLVVSMENGH